MIGHNQPSFDSVVEENLLRGIYLSQLNCITRAIRDPRLRARHLQVLAQIIERTNAKTGHAYPGRARLASDIVYYEIGEARHYSEASIATTISELIDCGYIIAKKMAAEGKGRALAHYTTVAPSIEDLQREITAWCESVKARPKRDFPAAKPIPDVDTRINVNTRINVSHGAKKDVAKSNTKAPDVDDSVNDNAGINVRADVDTGIGADVNTGIGQELVEDLTGSLVGAADFSLEPTSASADAEGAKRKKGTRLPENWVLPQEWRRRTQAAHGLSDRQIDAQATKFYRFWVAKPGKDAAKLRWDLTWDNWVDNAIERGLKPEGLGAKKIEFETEAERLDRIRMGPEKYAAYVAKRGASHAR